MLQASWHEFAKQAVVRALCPLSTGRNFMAKQCRMSCNLRPRFKTKGTHHQRTTTFYSGIVSVRLCLHVSMSEGLVNAGESALLRLSRT